MEIPKILTRVVHSETKFAWNVVGTTLGSKYKIARVPYECTGQNATYDMKYKQEAYELATFISTCFNVAYNDHQINNTNENQYISAGVPLFDGMIKEGLPADEISLLSGWSKIGKSNFNFSETIKKLNKENITENIIKNTKSF